MNHNFEGDGDGVRDCGVENDGLLKDATAYFACSRRDIQASFVLSRAQLVDWLRLWRH